MKEINTKDELEKQAEYTDMLKDILFMRYNCSQPKAHVRTYGCQQNVADSEKIKGMLEEMGCALTESAEEADIIIFNTCAVREHAEDRVFGNVGELKALKRKKPSLLIGLCGCMMEQKHIAESCIMPLRQAKGLLKGALMTVKFMREYLCTVTAVSKAGCLSCMVVTISAHTA